MHPVGWFPRQTRVDRQHRYAMVSRATSSRVPPSFDNLRTVLI